MNGVYEKHASRNFLGRSLPFIFHNDTLSGVRKTFTHWHENPEFLLCRSGKGQVLIASDWHPFEKGTLICVPPGEIHSVVNDADEPLFYDCLIVDVSFCNENGLADEQMHFTAATDDPIAAARFDDVAAARAAIDTPLAVLHIRAAVLQFLLYTAQHHAAPAVIKNDSATAEVKKVMLYVKNHYADPITLTQAAEIAGFSLYYFSHEFKRVTGVSFMHYLNSVRIERATTLLREGVGVTETCFRCGFHDLSYFSRTYKKLTGTVPSRVHA